jgi:hypothetical protein
VKVPASVQSGDQLVAFLTTNRLATTTTPAGWSLRATVSDGTDLRSWVFTREAAIGTASSTFSTTLDNLSKTNLTLLAYQGAGIAEAVVGVAETGNTSRHAAPAAPISAAGSALVRYWADKVAAPHGWTVPVGHIGRTANVGSGAGQITSVAADLSGVAAGTTAAAFADGGVSSSKAVAWTVVLPPG